MLQTAISTTALRDARPVKNGGHAQQEQVAALLRRLRAAGIEPKIHTFSWGVSSGGIALRVQVRELIAAPDQLRDWLEDIRGLLERGVRLTLTLDDLGLDDRSIEYLQCFCDEVRAALPVGGLPKQQLGLCVAARDIALPAYQVISSAVLGCGPRYVAVSGDYMDIDTVNRAIATDWSALFQRRTGLAPLWPVYAAGIRTCCPLLNNEATNALLPGSGIAVPGGSAWLPMELDITRFAAANGVLDHDAIAQALDTCVALGDGLFSLLSWPKEQQEMDAWLNRRLAIMLTGLGDLVMLRGQSPADLSCLRELDQLVASIHDALWKKSRQMAELCGPLPMLEQQHPAGRWSDDAHNQAWAERWQKAMETAQVRHRNLLVMSPYSVLPRRGPIGRDYIDLLPLIAHSDALSFASPPKFPGWTAAEFTAFHRRAWAVIQRRNAASFIAAGV